MPMTHWSARRYVAHSHMTPLSTMKRFPPRSKLVFVLAKDPANEIRWAPRVDLSGVGVLTADDPKARLIAYR